ncbi:MAG: hypothetical protein PF481_03940 [Bacteroidales bacterium]|jgi:hypothetical protein|nr:hypothetical protein [Bacteroidales bacterium]
MKLHTLIIITAFFILSSNTCIAQQSILDTQLSYSARQQSIGKILKDLEQLSNARFTYNSALINTETRTSIEVEDKSLSFILNLIFNNSFKYQQIGTQILITPKKTSSIQPVQSPKPRHKSPPLQRPPQKSEEVRDTIIVYDTIRLTIQDTIRHTVYDTLYAIDSTDFYKSKELFSRKNASYITFSAYTGIHQSFPIYWNNDSYSLLLQESEKNDFGTNHAIFAQYLTKKSSYGVGIQYINHRNKSSFTTIDVNNETEIYVDTLWYWQYSLLFNYYKHIPGQDSILIPVYDSTYTYTLQENPKKTETTTQYNSINSYKYIGIPLSYGYRHFFSESIEIQPTFFFVPLFLIQTNAILPNEDQTGIIYLDKNKYLRVFTYSIGISGNIMLHINKNHSIHIKPFCMSSPTLMKKKYAHSQKSNISFGIEWGASYTIPYKISTLTQKINSLF